MDVRVREEAHRTCGARTRSGHPCRNVAGKGTDHLGVGRCRFHGGASPIKHGRYSAITRHKLGDLVEKYLEDPDPLDLREELALARALLHRALDHQLVYPDAMKLIAEVSKVVKRIEDIRSQDAVSRPELARIWSEMLRVVQMECDEATAQRIAEGWKQIRL